MRNDIMIALTDLTAMVSFGGGGRSGGGGHNSQNSNYNRNQPAGPRDGRNSNTTTVSKTPGQTVNREGKGDLGAPSNKSSKDWSGCVNVNLGVIGGEVCYGK